MKFNTGNIDDALRMIEERFDEELFDLCETEVNEDGDLVYIPESYKRVRNQFLAAILAAALEEK